MTTPLVSVIVSTLGTQWLPKCFASLRSQTIFDQIEIILVDDFSTDGTAALARKELATFPRATVIQNSSALGYAGSSNRGAYIGKGEWLCVLNDDTQLEPDCLEKLLVALREAGADAAVPALAEYDSMKFVPSAPMGFDVFGRPSWSESDHSDYDKWHPCFMIGGAGFLIRRTVWEYVGGFDAAHFMYAEDDDLSWKVWLAGYKGIYVGNAILHHRTRRENDIWEIKSFTRYLVNRNSLLVVAKNAQHILLICALLQILMLLSEACLFLIISRRWTFVWNSYLKAIGDAFRMGPHIFEMRKLNRQIRRRSDWEMARMFMRLRINRWDMVKAFFIHGKRPVVK